MPLNSGKARSAHRAPRACICPQTVHDGSIVRVFCRARRDDAQGVLAISKTTCSVALAIACTYAHAHTRTNTSLTSSCLYLVPPLSSTSLASLPLSCLSPFCRSHHLHFNSPSPYSLSQPAPSPLLSISTPFPLFSSPLSKQASSWILACRRSRENSRERW